MAPMYFFYNLPPSESKDILQDMLDSEESRRCTKKETTNRNSDTDRSCAAGTQTDKCLIQ